MAEYIKKVSEASVDAYITSKTIALAQSGEVVIGVKKHTETTTRTVMGDGGMRMGGSITEPTGFVTVTLITE